MSGTEFKREKKTDQPVIALCYDFDKTLSPDDMQAQGYIQSVGFNIGEFWEKSNGLASANDMDQNLAYMYTMKEEAAGKVLFTKKELAKYGSKVALFPGVEEWFERIRKYGEEKGVIIEHYIISSGLKEMIEGTSISKNGAFKRIYATSFYCNKNGVAVWPAQVVNYTNKTQFLFRISKGVLDVNDPAVNDSFPADQLRVPFRNMIYIGDSDTDIPCMKLVNSHGGYSIGVFDPEKNDRRKVHKMIRENRIGYFAPADYSEGKELDKLIKLVIDKAVFNEQLEDKKNAYKKEASLSREKSEEEQEKSDLLSALESSANFKNTHNIIRKLSQYKNWQPDDILNLLSIAYSNSQVRYILSDFDIKKFYLKILEKAPSDCEEAELIREIIKPQDD